jgi:CRISPR/Cas system endoribonuclease Cas6 (RAMP superfamily)
MRVLLKATLPVETTNHTITNGTMQSTLQQILADLKPEAAYFLTENGRRAGFLFVNIADPSEIPAIAEPFFQAFHATVEVTPVMTPDDLAKAGPAIEKAAKKYGSAARAKAA